MKVYFEEGYQGVTFKEEVLAKTPIYPDPVTLIDHLEFAKKTGLIDTYMVQYVKARNAILSPEEVDYYKEKTGIPRKNMQTTKSGCFKDQEG